MLGRCGLVMALGAVFLTGPLTIGDAIAKKPTSHLVATVDGKRVKASKHSLLSLYSTSSFSVTGATKPRRRLVRTVTVTCGPVDLRAVALPATLTGCFGSYTEAGSKASRFRQWTGTGIELAVDFFDGSRIVGTFRGTLADASSANPTTAPASVEGGRFSLVVRDTGV